MVRENWRIIPLAGLGKSSQFSGEEHRLMHDPTELVITGGFAAALGIFLIFAVVRSIMEKRNRTEAIADDVWMDAGGEECEESEVVRPPELPVGRVPVWFYGKLDWVGVGFVFAVFAWLALASVKGAQGGEPSLNPAVLLVNIGFQFFMAGVVAILVVARVGWSLWLGLRWPGWRWVVVIAPGSVGFMWLLLIGLQGSGYMEWMESLGVETVQDSVKLLQKSENPVVLGLMVFAAVVAAPLCEEVVFRGYLYPVAKKYAGMWPAALCSALVFASAHGSLAAMLPLVLLGGLLVFFYEKTGSLWAPIAVHCCFNSATVVIQMAARYLEIPLDATP